MDTPGQARYRFGHPHRCGKALPGGAADDPAGQGHRAWTGSSLLIKGRPSHDRALEAIATRSPGRAPVTSLNMVPVYGPETARLALSLIIPNRPRHPA